MAISFPLSIPTNTAESKIEIYTQTITSVSRSPFTGQSQVHQYDGDGWLARVSLPVLTRELAAPWIAFLTALRGQKGTFLMGETLKNAPLGVATGTPLVKGSSQTGTELETDGWSSSVTGILKADDYIQIGNYLYKVLQDVNSDGSGNATLDIFPALRSSPADNETIVTSNCKGIFRLTKSSVPVSKAGAGKLYIIAFEAEEAI